VAESESTPGRLSPKVVGGAALAVVALVFVLQNRAKARITFLFLHLNIGLWFGLLVTFVLGIVAGLVLGRARRD
jgi:uncharacterized integral membrane protein